MQQSWLLYILAFVGAFCISLFVTPYVKKLSIRVGAVDLPRKRGMHKEPIPRMGGIAIVLGFIGTMLFLLPFIEELRSREFAGFIIGALIILMVGILDDIYSVKPKFKLSFQIISALIVIFTGTTIEFITLPFNVDLSNISIPITLIWIIGITNAVNLIDGVDGLAAGVSSIAAITLSILCIMSGSMLAVVLTVVLAGSCLGFLPRNFSPAEIIMGDTGALFLGYVLAVTSIMGVYKSYAILSVAISAFVLALPIFDTLFAMSRRILNGKPIMQADRGHLHHRLIDSGLSPSKAVIILYILSGVAGFISILIALSDFIVFVVALSLFIILSIMVYVYKKRTFTVIDEKENDN